MLFSVVVVTIVVLFIVKLVYDVQSLKTKRGLIVENEQPMVIPDEFLVDAIIDDTENFS